MAEIKNVNYEELPGKAGQMRSHGQELNTELTTAYQRITDMHNVWYGVRYNSLVMEFNNIIPQLNELLDLVVGDIPYTLETIANNYSKSDKGANVTSAQKTAPNKITEIPVHDDTGKMRFITADVETVQSQVTANLENAKTKMDTIESVYGQIQWESEAADAFRSTFTRLKSQIVASFDNIKTQFTKLMSQAQQDVQSAENSNTVQ